MSNNRMTIKYRFSIPRIDDPLDDLACATAISKIDLKSGYHQTSIGERDERMQFRLSNSPSTFIRLMTQTLQPFLVVCVVVYFDDIPV